MPLVNFILNSMAATSSIHKTPYLKPRLQKARWHFRAFRMCENLFLILPLILLDGHLIPQRLPVIGQLLQVIGEGLVQMVGLLKLITE